MQTGLPAGPVAGAGVQGPVVPGRRHPRCLLVTSPRQRLTAVMATSDGPETGSFAEVNHQAAARAARFEAPVRLGGVFGREGRRDPEGQPPVLDVASQLLQLVLPATVVGDGNQAEVDAALWVQRHGSGFCAWAHVHENAVVANGTESGGAHDRCVDEAVDARRHVLPHLRGEVVASRDDDVSPETATRSTSAGAASAMTRKPAMWASWTTYPPRPPAAPVTATVSPGENASVSIASIAVKPFIGSVEASTSLVPCGACTTQSAGSTTFCA